MATIRLIVTGDLEELALHESLRRVFGDSRHDGEEVIWDPPRKLHSATSRRLSTTERTSRPMRDLAKAMLSEVGIGKRGTPADLVIVVDDVELDNVDREAVIVKHFQDAIASHLQDQSQQARARYQSLLRERCSFHLLRPMVEAYFFGDSSALRSTGVQSTPMLRHSDVELFDATDPDPDWLQECLNSNDRQRRERPWWRHECHPKHYLEHLLGRHGIIYDEKLHGESALQNLVWNQVPKTDTDCAIVRCLFEDLSDWFGIPNPIGKGAMQQCVYPLPSIDRSKLMLRNL